MRKWQLFEDICCPSPFLPLAQRPTLSCDVTSKKIHDDMALLLTSDSCCRGGSLLGLSLDLSHIISALLFTPFPL